MPSLWENLYYHVIFTVNCSGFGLSIRGKVRFFGSASCQGSLSLKEDSSVYTAARVGRKKLITTHNIHIDLVR